MTALSATRITVDGRQHIVRSGSYAKDKNGAWVTFDGDWIAKDNPTIEKVESGRLVFEPDAVGSPA